MKRKLISFLMVVFFGTLVLKGATYYVSPSGSDNNGGTLSAPFATIQKAVDMSTSGGDIINLRAGTYNQTVNISNKSGITITRYSGETAILDGTGAGYSQFFMINNSSNITITGLTMRELSRNFARAIYVYETTTPASSNLTFSNNIITQINCTSTRWTSGYNTSTVSGSNGILVAGAINSPGSAITNVTITGNTVTQCEVGFSEGITVKGNINGFLIANNTVGDISNIGIDAVGLLTWPALSDPTCTARNGVIRNNTAYNCVNSYSDNGAIYVDGGNTINILYNRVYNNKYGINVGVENQIASPNGNTFNVEVRDNLVYNNRLAGLLMGTSGSGTVGGLVTNCRVYGNTFVSNGLTTNHEVFLQYLNNVTIMNNIFYMKSGNVNLGWLGSGIGSGLVFNYNIYYNGATPVPTFYLNGQTLAYYGNANSIYANPMLTNSSPSSPNAVLLSGSPAINTGNPSFTILSGETDFYGSTRIQGGRVDIGCAESGSTTTIPVTGVSVSPTSASITVGGTQQLTRTIAPSNATNQNVTWSSNNASVATVNSSGLVTGVAAGSATITVTTVDGGRTATCAITVTSSGGSLPSPWATSDIGAVGATGSAGYSGTTFTVIGSGADIWGTVDEFRYVYRAVTGDVTITARVASVSNSNAWAKAGVMIRDGLGASVAHASMVVTPSSGVSFQRRTTASGTSTSTTTTGITAPRWVRLQRVGSTITAYQSANGTTWTTVGSQSITMSTVYVGLAVTSHADGTLCTALFDNVVVTTSSSVAVTGVTMSPTSASIGVGGTTQLTATVQPTNATNKTVSWSSSNTGIASVNASGLVTGVAAGSATITITTQDGGRTATCAVTVTSGGGGGVTITIDGSLSDWSSVSAIATATGQTCTSMKVYDDVTYFYFGIAGSGMNATNYQIFLNTDNNTATGYQDASFASGSGAEYLIENGGLFQSTGTGWSWSAVSTTITASKNTSVTEVRIPRSALGTLSSSIKVAYKDINDSWAMVSQLGYSTYTRLKGAWQSEISEGLSGEISMYPNPATDVLHVNLGEGISTIHIYSLTGELIYSKQSNQLEEIIDVNELNAKGLVLLHVLKNGHESTFRVILK